ARGPAVADPELITAREPRHVAVDDPGQPPGKPADRRMRLGGQLRLRQIRQHSVQRFADPREPVEQDPGVCHAVLLLGDWPAARATARASASATTVCATTMLFMSLTASPAPTGPQCVISAPMQARSGRSRMNTSGSVPTMIDSVPSRAACAVRAIGASAKAT